MNEENKKNSFYNLSVITDKADKLVSLIEEEINNELENSKSSDEILKLIEHVSSLGRLPVFFIEKQFLYTISENIFIENKLNTIH
ncbi:MAG: hypothetical protein AABZ74_00650 [Cyanobacteriota bacterium]